MRTLQVRTLTGELQGFTENGFQKFLGIPYAESPKGELRFKRAVPKRPWEGIFIADTFADAAPQTGRRGSEDCLALNVIRPLEGENLPVFVWIHGGGYMTGSANDLLCTGESFARDGIVFVSIQYRLNVLGFFEFCTYRGCEDFETNRGLSDMVTALQWIHENIAAFGGDPGNVTIGGESAGAAAVVTLMAVPSVQGIFQNVIAESALCNCVMTTEQARANMDLYIEGMGWTENDLTKLRIMPAEEMLAGLDNVSAKHQYRTPGLFLPCPTIDDLLPERPLDAISKGSAKGVRLLIGTNLHEGTMFVHSEKTGFPNSWPMVEAMFRNTGNEDAYERVRGYYERSSFERNYGETFIHFATDYAFQMPSIKAAALQAKYGKSFLYRFEFFSEASRQNGMLSAHASELPYVFGVMDHPFSKAGFGGESKETVEKMIQEMHHPWVQFIKTGEPDPENWTAFANVDSPVRIFDRETRSEILPHKELMEVWEGLRFYEG